MTYGAVALAIALVCLLGGFFWGRSNVKAQVEQAVEKEHVALDMREFTMRQQLDEAIAEIAWLRPLAEELGQVQKRLKREQAEYARMKAEFNAATRGSSTQGSAEEEPVQMPEPTPVPDSADVAIQKLLQSLEAFNQPDANSPAANEQSQQAEQNIANVPKPGPLTPPIPPAATQPPTQLPPAATPPRPSQPVTAAAKPEPVIKPQPAIAPQPAMKPQPAIKPQPISTPQPVKVAPPEPRKLAPTEPVKPVSPAPRKPAPAEAGKPGQTVDEWQEFARQLDALTGRKK
jgi:hypothetical protein